MKAISLICAVFLLLALLNLPMAYYTFLRIIVTIGAIAIVVKELGTGFNFWVISFAVVAILFNPLIPIYLNDKEAWMPIDIIAAILFIVKSLNRT